MVRPGLAPMPCEAAERPWIAVAAVGGKLVRRGGVLIDERKSGRARLSSRVCWCAGVYFNVSKFVRMHVVVLLTAVARVVRQTGADRHDHEIFGSCKRYSDI